MNKLDALESIKEAWLNDDLPLGKKIIDISTCYYSAGLDLDTAAAFVHATQSEFDAFLALSEFDDEIIELISKANPPKSAWTFLSSASDEEVAYALNSLLNPNRKESGTAETASEYIYYAMIEIAGLSVEQKVAALSGDTIKHALKKGTDFGILNDWETMFIKSIGAQRKRGKTLSDKQASKLADSLRKLVEEGAIKHNSIDGDQEICDEILEALEL